MKNILRTFTKHRYTLPGSPTEHMTRSCLPWRTGVKYAAESVWAQGPCCPTLHVSFVVTSFVPPSQGHLLAVFLNQIQVGPYQPGLKMSLEGDTGGRAQRILCPGLASLLSGRGGEGGDISTGLFRGYAVLIGSCVLSPGNALWCGGHL